MPRKKRTPAAPPKAPEAPADELDAEFEDTPKTQALSAQLADLPFDEPELPDDSPDLATMVARFQIQVEARLDAMEQKQDKKREDVLRQLAALTDTSRRLERDAEKVRTVFDDLRHAATKSTGEMVTMLKQAHQAAGEAKDAAKVYEKLVDSRPDLLRRIEVLAEKVGQYRHEHKIWQSTVEELAKRVSAGEQLDEDYALTKHVVDDIGKRVHQINTNGVLATVREAKAAERQEQSR